MGIRSEEGNIWSVGSWKVRVGNGSWFEWDFVGRGDEQVWWVCKAEGCARARSVRTQRTQLQPLGPHSFAEGWAQGLHAPLCYRGQRLQVVKRDR